MARIPWKCHPGEARIAEILPGSIAEELALLPGDVIRAVNGQALSDYIQYRFAIAEEELTLEVERGDESAIFEIEKESDEDLGIVFAGDVFDGVRPCRNKCIFCFEDQMPSGMRPSLRLKDDDFRLSFLHGNFLTLTNLTDDDLSRICREHLSPLFVSIHTTDAELRRRMLQNSKAPDVLEQLRRLGEGGIEVHAQIVLCPGWNDGEALEKTLSDLAALYSTVISVGVVPVGLTRHRPASSNLRSITPQEAGAAIDIIECWQTKMLPVIGTRLIYAADEFYLASTRPLPPAKAYEGYPQKENGIGLARIFLDEIDALKLPNGVTAKEGLVTLATGILAAPLLEKLADRLRDLLDTDLQIIAVPNRFYGEGVFVAGLLTGSDLLAELTGKYLGRLLVLPAAMLNAEGLFLDDKTPSSIEEALNTPIRFCSTPDGVVKLLI